MKKAFFLLAMLLSQTLSAQGPWKHKLYSEEQKINLVFDLYEESVDVPGMDMFGPMNGYLNGDVYGVWTITSFKIKSPTEATVRLSNDFGSETQEVDLTQKNDSIYEMDLKGTVVIKKVRDKKLNKIDSTVLFKIKE